MANDNGTRGVFPKNSADLVIMNPPFTNNRKRGGKFDDEVRKRMQNREKEIIASVQSLDPELASTIDANSMSTWFLPPVAEAAIKENGTLAFVAPTAMCIGDSAATVRKYLAERYQIEMVVTSHDPKKTSFSENTGIHESIFILRRISGGTDKPTKFFNLRKMPENKKDVEQIVAQAKSRSNSSPSRSGEKASAILCPAGTWGRQTEFLAQQIRRGNWSAVQWYQPKIQHFLDKIQQHPDMIFLGEKFQIGPAGRRIADAFEPCSDAEAEVYEFRSTSMFVRDRMFGKPDQPVKTRKNARSKAQIYMSQRSRIMICCSLGIQSNSIVSTYCKDLSFGAKWSPVRGMQPEHEKPMCAWFNSTPGIYQFLNNRARTLTWSQYHPSQTKKILIPDFTKLDLKPFLNAFEQVKDQPLDRFRHIPTNPARQVLDRAAAETLDIPYTEIQEWGRLLAAEPTVSNRMAPLEEETTHE